MKIRRLIGLAVAAVMMLSTTVSAFAWTADYSETETFDGGKSLNSTFKVDEFSKQLDNVQPGDTIQMTAKIQNNTDKDSNWYLSNTVLQNLESGGGSDGAYYYVLTYDDGSGKPVDIFNSKTVGGTNGEGLSEATQALGDWVYVDTLAKNGDNGIVTLSVTFEGDTINNAYFESVARLQIVFATEEATQSVVPPQKNTPGKNPTSTPVRTGIVKTGDSAQALMYSVMTALAGIVLLLAFILKRKKEQEEEVA